MIRWIKVFRDLWNNRSRTVMVILSICVGVFAIGLIGIAQQALVESLDRQYQEIRPADAILQTEPMLDDEFVESIRNIRGVKEAEGRRSLPLRVSLDGSGETWRDLTLYRLQDYEDQRLFLVHPQDGSWPPGKGEVLMERASMAYLGLETGDTLLVKTSDGRKYTLAITGRVHDLYRVPPVIEGWIYGYINDDTLRGMGEPDGFDELYLSAEDPAMIRSLADKAADRIEGQGFPVYQKSLPVTGEHPLYYIIETVLILLGLVAAMSMLLSALLVINVISAVIAQQERQIAIMKAIGARSWQIISSYYVMVMILGLIACLIAIPLSVIGAKALAAFTSEMINFNAPRVALTPQSLLLQLGVGLLIPLLAATPVILVGTRLSPAAVLSEYGINQVWGGAGFLDRLLQRIPGLTRDTLLALRNPFRKRGRLILSLVTLTFAGAVFMAIVNLRGSLNTSLNEMFAFWRHDAWVIIDGHIPAERLETEARAVPGVTGAEAWGFSLARYVRPDGTESDNLYLLAPPAGTPMLDPPIIEGRPLQPGDLDAIVVSPGFLAKEPGLHLGGPMTLKIEGREQIYTIVGVVNMIGNSSIGYFTIIDYSAFTRHVRESNRANAVCMTYENSSLDETKRITSIVEKQFDQAGIDVISTFMIADERQEIEAAFSIIVALLMVMTVLLATVGGLGLMGTMSLNVIERTREIGVMRAYGSSNRTIFRIVILEGLMIGLMSWILAIGLSIPISIFLARMIGVAFMDYPMSASITPGGILIWAALVIVISIVASFFPAIRAVRLTVTQVLAYE